MLLVYMITFHKTRNGKHGKYRNVETTLRTTLSLMDNAHCPFQTTSDFQLQCRIKLLYIPFCHEQQSIFFFFNLSENCHVRSPCKVYIVSTE